MAGHILLGLFVVLIHTYERYRIEVLGTIENRKKKEVARPPATSHRLATRRATRLREALLTIRFIF